MKSYRIAILLAASLFCVLTISFGQGSPSFDVDAYKQFLSSHQNLTTTQLRALHSAGIFSAEALTNPATARYFDSIDARYKLTTYEKSLIGEHGFMATERLQSSSFGTAFTEIYNRDLPVFVSTDAILHSLHMSWDKILMEVETGVLGKKLDTLLTRLHNQVPVLAAKYSSRPEMRQMINDIDVYLTVPRVLLGTASGPKLSENSVVVQELLKLVVALKPASIKLFSDTERMLDFSQFTVRGHYTQTLYLSQYFQAMIWLGRTEICLIAPESDDIQQSKADILRQTIDAVLVEEAAESGNAFPLLTEIDTIIRSFIAESDNVTLENVRSLIQEAGLASADELLDSLTLKNFQEILATKAYAFQRINSQILMSDPMSPEQIKPASAFLLLGQRFIVDSYTTGNVVYDKIVYNNGKVLRMLPSALDVLFAIGNDAAVPLLKPELDFYHYSSNLAALRYMVDSYEPAFWQSSIYNGWLHSVRTLNPPADKTALPTFMQTAAWWQEKMNTQLASWAQLRHDFILYAKQSYSGGNTCSFPESYVEPIPEFYDAIKTFAHNAATTFQNPPLSDKYVARYFLSMKGIADTLGTIARKELSKTLFSEQEKLFLRTMLSSTSIGCGTLDFKGWYARLYYTGSTGLSERNMTIADIHTAPTDAGGAMVGWVLHVGTGPINLAVVVTEVQDGGTTAFIGPVMSYYEHLATNFKRLTDEEWKTMYSAAPSMRPSFTNLYLADANGATRGVGPSLATGVDRQTSPALLPTSLVLRQNFPNPFNSSTIISFIIPDGLTNSHAALAIYDVQGRLVKRLLSQKMPAGNYATRWDGTMENGLIASSGVYFYHLIVGDQRQIGKMSFVK